MNRAVIGSRPSVGVSAAIALAASPRLTSGLDTSVAKSLEFGQRRLERIEAARDRVDLAFVTGEAEQSGGVAPR